MQANPQVSVRLDLTDRLVDLLNEGVDCAVRIGEMADSSLASSKLGEMRRRRRRQPGLPGANTGHPVRRPNWPRTTVCRLANSVGGRCARPGR
jgi:DNA-binding transcriptional LysR family regulator